MERRIYKVRIKELDMICRYKKLVFLAMNLPISKMFPNLTKVTFVDFFEGTDGECKDFFRKKYPNRQFRVFGKDLPRSVRRKIENSPEFSAIKRDEILNELEF